MNDAAKITSTHLAKNLSDVLNRVHYQGTHFTIERNGTPLATLGPLKSSTPIPIDDWVSRLRLSKSPTEGFAEDLESVVADQPLQEDPEWPCS